MASLSVLVLLVFNCCLMHEVVAKTVFDIQKNSPHLGGQVPSTQFHFVVITDHDADHKDITNAGTKNIDELKIKCLYTPGCKGFNTDGFLKNDTTNPNESKGCDLYVLTQGAPSSYHFLEIPNMDADLEDLRHESGSIAQLQTLCLNDTACAGFNSGGWLKATVTKMNTNKGVTLYVKLGGMPHPLPPPAPPTPPPPPPPPPGPGPWMANVWPVPSQYTNGSDTTTVVPGSTFFKLDTSGMACTTLTQATQRYMSLTFPHASTQATSNNGASVTFLSIKVTNLDQASCIAPPQLETNEGYTLTVTDTDATLTADTVYGAIRGLETFSQLVTFDFQTESYVVKLAPWTIVDTPRFPHRGLMIDTSRHFQTLASIKKMIDSLAYAKINVLHWHMSDSQSFPFESKTNPKLWNAAHSIVERYTQADVVAMVEYARLRAVRVMVEFDMPGHAGSWCTGYPEVCPSATCTQPLNPASNRTFELIEELLGECTGGTVGAGLFPSNMIHLGGDEVNTNCWTSTPAVQKWLTEKNFTADQAYGYFVNKSAHIAIAQGRRPVQWNEVFIHFGTEMPKEAIVHAWNDRNIMGIATSQGYNAINSQGWYLDHLTSEWEAMYTNDPLKGVMGAAAAKLVLGGQGEMWGETVDASDIQNTVWPRMAAIAEQLWSPATVTNATTALNSAFPRLESFRCLLNRRGVAAAPVNNQNAREGPPGSGSCLDQ